MLLGSLTDGREAEIAALVTLVATAGLAALIHRALGRYARPIAEAVTRGELSAIAVTRLRLLRRLIWATILLIGTFLALGQFVQLREVATGLLASSAVVGIVIGFAARQTIANAMAGLSLAIAQPIRIGDVVDWHDERGVVEDITLMYTYIRVADRRRLIVPNEQIAGDALHNHSTGDPLVTTTAAVWVDSEHAVRALALLREGMGDGTPGDAPAGVTVDVDAGPGVTVGVGEVERDRTRLTIERVVEPLDQARIAGELREQTLGLLADAGMLTNSTRGA